MTYSQFSSSGNEVIIGGKYYKLSDVRRVWINSRLEGIKTKKEAQKMALNLRKLGNTVKIRKVHKKLR